MPDVTDRSRSGQPGLSSVWLSQTLDRYAPRCTAARADALPARHRAVLCRPRLHSEFRGPPPDTGHKALCPDPGIPSSIGTNTNSLDQAPVHNDGPSTSGSNMMTSTRKEVFSLAIYLYCLWMAPTP